MRKILTAPSIRPPFARYAHGVGVPADWRFLVTSGQLGIAPDESIPPDARGQADLIFKALTVILAEGDMAPENAIRLNAFVTDRAHMTAYMAARDAWLAEVPNDDLPASTLVIVSGFTRPEFLVEVELTAAAP
ncbi:RidA family protein [Actibacterium sp. 188UL27-1]|uniref:RidA family protein n=1 Tax=Actibacterium sp. 188UL27-1 TaxID=2786961 RepID=UPI00195C1FAB|nr:Rid family hydrolase [Actibacterium sp. 188UL27-1]MBM7069460.1 RidA family protein [Actibacterium sp. 188UL27-1]